MMHTRFVMLIMLTMIVLACGVSANPVTIPVAGADITNRQVTFHATGGVSPCWFQWGIDDNRYWTTPNLTISGDFSDTQYSSPLLTGYTYTVVACDSTGCDLTSESFYVPKAYPMNTTNFGAGVISIMRSGFNITQTSGELFVPYSLYMSGASTTVTSGAASIVWGIFFFIIFAGYWIRGKGILLPAIIAIMSGSLLVTNSILNSPFIVAPVFMSMGLPLLMIGFAGVALSWFTNR